MFKLSESTDVWTSVSEEEVPGKVAGVLTGVPSGLMIRFSTKNGIGLNSGAFRLLVEDEDDTEDARDRGPKLPFIPPGNPPDAGCSPFSPSCSPLSYVVVTSRFFSIARRYFPIDECCRNGFHASSQRRCIVNGGALHDLISPARLAPMHPLTSQTHPAT